MSMITKDSKFGIECNNFNDRKRFIYLNHNEPLKDYSVSAVPCIFTKDKALQLIQFIERQRDKLNVAELRQFNKQIAYMKLVEFDEMSFMHPNDKKYEPKETKI